MKGFTFMAAGFALWGVSEEWDSWQFEVAALIFFGMSTFWFLFSKDAS